MARTVGVVFGLSFLCTIDNIISLVTLCIRHAHDPDNVETRKSGEKGKTFGPRVLIS